MSERIGQSNNLEITKEYNFEASWSMVNGITRELRKTLKKSLHELLEQNPNLSPTEISAFIENKVAEDIHDLVEGRARRHGYIYDDSYIDDIGYGF